MVQNGNPPISLKLTEIYLNQFAKRMGQANYNAFNKWKTVWVAGFLQKKHSSIMWKQNCLKHFEIDPSTGRLALQIFWRPSRTVCCILISIIIKGFGGCGLICF